MFFVSRRKTRTTVDAGHRREPPPDGECGQMSVSVAGRQWAPSVERRGGTSCSFVALLATRDDNETPWTTSGHPICSGNCSTTGRLIVKSRRSTKSPWDQNTVTFGRCLRRGCHMKRWLRGVMRRRKTQWATPSPPRDT